MSSATTALPAGRSAESVSDRPRYREPAWGKDAAGRIASASGPASRALPSCSTIARVSGSSRTASTPPALLRWSRSIWDRDNGSREANGRDNRDLLGAAFLTTTGKYATYPVD